MEKLKILSMTILFSCCVILAWITWDNSGETSTEELEFTVILARNVSSILLYISIQYIYTEEGWIPLLHCWHKQGFLLQPSLSFAKHRSSAHHHTSKHPEKQLWEYYAHLLHLFYLTALTFIGCNLKPEIFTLLNATISATVTNSINYR